MKVTLNLREMKEILEEGLNKRLVDDVKVFDWDYVDGYIVIDLEIGDGDNDHE